jgi:hypothetical protein
MLRSIRAFSTSSGRSSRGLPETRSNIEIGRRLPSWSRRHSSSVSRSAWQTGQHRGPNAEFQREPPAFGIRLFAPHRARTASKPLRPLILRAWDRSVFSVSLRTVGIFRSAHSARRDVPQVKHLFPGPDTASADAHGITGVIVQQPWVRWARELVARSRGEESNTTWSRRKRIGRTSR